MESWLTHPGHVPSQGTQKWETLHYTSQIYSWLGDHPASQHTSPSWKRKLSAPTLRDSTSQNLNTSLGKTRLDAWQSRLGLHGLQPCPQVELPKSTAMHRCMNKWVQALLNECRCAKVPPLTWSPERNSGSNSSLIAGNKAWVAHQSNKPQNNQTKQNQTPQPQKTFSTTKKFGLMRKVTKPEQDEAGPNDRC